ncbi:hypothetical protein L798_10446 [Zootermopsis nevadensis]|uniref:Uncharacterized protein n=1 Tax=Zootermopsis nevadensis TaxID=136037 RepID=A0A067QZG6_ZOONE|nr:hypothetical protein L798_10446 [Zootermopsis nevadensis]
MLSSLQTLRDRLCAFLLHTGLSHDLHLTGVLGCLVPIRFLLDQAALRHPVRTHAVHLCCRDFLQHY